MRRKARTPKSTYRAILSVQAARDEASGLRITDRIFLPEAEKKPRRLLWAGGDIVLLVCLIMGLAVMTVRGFSVPVFRFFYPVLLLFSVGAALFFRNRWRRSLTACTLGLLVLYLLALFLWQEAFLRGMQQFGALLEYTLRKTYHARTLPAIPEGTDAAVFLLFAAVPVIVWLAVSLLQRHSAGMANLVIFPLLALLGLCGGATDVPAALLLVLGVVLSMAFSVPKWQYRMWGGKNHRLRRENQMRFQSVQKKAMALALAAVLILSVPGYWLVRPLLSVSLQPARQLSVAFQSRILTRVGKLLPELSAGAWKLNVEAVGGGVQDGALRSEEGYLLEDVEDLRLTLNTKPRETLFLKGFIGTVYQDGIWKNPYEANFDGAALNWNTEGNARLYIQNLPFLRTAYAAAQSGSEREDIAAAMGAVSAEPARLLVETLHGNDAYTYVPYGTFLNDYYQIASGDGAVEGQSRQEDRFYFFFREDAETVLGAWNALEATDNVLDRVEESYRAFCESMNRGECAAGNSLEAPVKAALEQNRWTPEQNPEEITGWIRQYLAEHYRYQGNPEAVPEGEDPLEYFLTTSQSGNSVQFASAAVVLYRLFGIPARYVVGYEVPATLFSSQADGTYTATVQSDNAQAWAEIYVPGLGWQPKDMTPGVIGTYEEVGPGGERIEAAAGETAEPGSTEASRSEPVSSGDPVKPAHTFSASERLLTWLGWLALGLGIAAALGGFAGCICRGVGWDPLHRRSRQQRLVGIFRTLYARSRRLGLPEHTDSQSETFLTFCEGELMRRDREAAALLRPAVEGLYRCCFGAEPASEGDIRRMRRVLFALYRTPRT